MKITKSEVVTTTLNLGLNVSEAGDLECILQQVEFYNITPNQEEFKNKLIETLNTFRKEGC